MATGVWRRPSCAIATVLTEANSASDVEKATSCRSQLVHDSFDPLRSVGAAAVVAAIARTGAEGERAA
jgi:hypothetical protein